MAGGIHTEDITGHALGVIGKYTECEVSSTPFAAMSCIRVS